MKHDEAQKLQKPYLEESQRVGDHFFIYHRDNQSNLGGTLHGGLQREDIMCIMEDLMQCYGRYMDPEGVARFCREKILKAHAQKQHIDNTVN